MTGDSTSRNDFLSELATDVLYWLHQSDDREDVFPEVRAYALATYVEGDAVTPRGFYDNEVLRS